MFWQIGDQFIVCDANLFCNCTIWNLGLEYTVLLAKKTMLSTRISICLNTLYMVPIYLHQKYKCDRHKKLRYIVTNICDHFRNTGLVEMATPKDENLTLLLMTFLACWIIVTNVIVIIILLRSKSLRSESHVIFLINIMGCFLARTIAGSPYYNITWLAGSLPAGCVVVRISSTFVWLLLNFATFLLMIDVCVQLKQNPYYGLGPGRSVLMVGCTWILAGIMTVLLQVALPHIAPSCVELEDCYLKHSFKYDIIHDAVYFLAPASLLLFTIFAAAILRCRQMDLRKLYRHQHTQDVFFLIAQARTRVLPSCVCTMLHLCFITPPGVLHMYYVLMSSTEEVLLALRVAQYINYAAGAILPLFWVLLHTDLRKNCMSSSE